MNQIELLNGIKAIKGCTFAHIEYITEEKLPKKLGLGVVTKFVSGEVQLNYDYENAVNNRLERAGLARTFSAQSLPWGVWETPNKVIDHKGELYLRFYCVKNAKMQTEYFVDGRPALQSEIDIIKAYTESKSKGSATQSAEGLDENQVEPRNVKFSAITALKCGSIFYDAVRIAV